VRVYEGTSQTPALEFLAFDPQFSGGVAVSSGDINGDGTSDIVAAAGAGAGPHVRVFDGGSGALLSQFFAESSSFSVAFASRRETSTLVAQPRSSRPAVRVAGPASASSMALVWNLHLSTL
jgi:hypothetical protein